MHTKKKIILEQSKVQNIGQYTINLKKHTIRTK